MPVSREILIERSTPRSRATDLFMIAFFAFCVLAPGWASLRGGNARAAQVGKAENRRPEALPPAPLDLAALAAYPARFDRWFEDAFAGRTSMVRLGALAKYELFESAIGSRWRFGGDGWLFCTDYSALPATTGVAPLGEDRLERWRETIVERRDWLAAEGVEYLLALVPYKGAVYPEKLPGGLTSRGPDHRQQMLDDLAEHTDVRTIDLLPPLREAAAQDLPTRHAYSPHGVHWTEYGGYAAYRAILASLPDVFGGVKPRRLDEFDLVGEQIQTDSWDRRIYLDGVMVQDEAALMPKERSYRRIPSPDGSTRRDTARQGPEDGPRVMVVHDSFGPNVSRLLALHASRLDSRWRPYLEADLVRELRPDVVIEIYSELSLSTRDPFRLSALQSASDVEAFHAHPTSRALLSERPPTLVAPFNTAAVIPGSESGSWQVDASKRPALIRFDLPADVLQSELEVCLELDAVGAGLVGLYDGPEPQGIPELGKVSPVKVPQGRSSHLVPLAPRADRGGLWLACSAGTPITLVGVSFRSVPDEGLMAAGN